MRTFKPEDLHRSEVHSTLLSGVAPRPVALVGTSSADGTPNLSPFSFFNAFSSNPPVVAFSPAYRGTDGSAKDTFRNLKETGECTISAVSFAIVEQISLASSNYNPETDEFLKCGLTKYPSIDIAAPGVAESPFIMECRLLHHYPVSEGDPGSGNIMICRVLRFHVRDSVYSDGRIDPQRLDLVSRMGYNWYCRASGDAVFEVPKPRWSGIGFDALPQPVLNSRILSGNDLAKLAGVETLPAKNEGFASSIPRDVTVDSVELELQAGTPVRALAALLHHSPALPAEAHNDMLHRIAKLFLESYLVEEAWQTLLLDD